MHGSVDPVVFMLRQSLRGPRFQSIQNIEQGLLFPCREQAAVDLILLPHVRQGLCAEPSALGRDTQDTAPPVFRVPITTGQPRSDQAVHSTGDGGRVHAREVCGLHS